MNFTMTKIAAGLVLASAAMSAHAVAIDNTSNFKMYDPDGAFVGGAAAPKLTGFIDTGAGTWGVASTATFFGYNWTASGGALFGPGTYTVDVNGDLSDAAPGNNLVTFTVGAGQMGGNINFAWNGSYGIDVFNVWNVSTVGLTTTYTSTDFGINGNPTDGILGVGMVDGPFGGFNANFNMVTTVPEASTYGMMLAGLGLVGFAVRRRKLVA